MTQKRNTHQLARYSELVADSTDPRVTVPGPNRHRVGQRFVVVAYEVPAAVNDIVPNQTTGRDRPAKTRRQGSSAPRIQLGSRRGSAFFTRWSFELTHHLIIAS